MRPKVTVYIATSLDGFIAREDDGLDWLGSVQVEGEDYGYATFMASVDTLILGRKTWDVVTAFPEWPYAGKRVIVLSHRPIEPRDGVERYEGPLGPLLHRLVGEGVGHVYLDGGAAVRQGLSEGVVDELILSLLPHLLGRGRPLFGPEVPEAGWALLSATPYPASGLVQLRYAARRS